MAQPANAPEPWLVNGHDATKNDTTRPLRIAIVGAGIGGLSAAISLRRAGHEVVLFEQSRFATEAGAAIHLCPNANGILRRWDVFPEEFGASTMSFLREYTAEGKLLRELDLTTPNKRWQHPWHLVHRVALHDKLKAVATSMDGPGRPARLHVSSKVVGVNPASGTVELEDGSVVTADVVVGADGIYSKIRNRVNGGSPPELFASGKAAYRFMMPKYTVENDPEMRFLVNKPDTLQMWFGVDRRVVMYPCNSNEDLNFVLIHPDSESHATWTNSWSKTSSTEQCLKVFKHFDPALKKLIAAIDPPILSVWQLLDMQPLDSWVVGRLGMLGDAAHPFTPYQAQGGAQAIEDAAALSVVLPLGTRPDEVPERLSLYNEIRRTRAHTIQQFSRQAGKDTFWVHGKPTLDMMQFTNYNFGHDEHHYARNLFWRWQWSRNPNLVSLAPTPFGPLSKLQVDAQPLLPADDATQHTTTATLTFKTSRTLLETLFPTTSFRFIERDTVCMATLLLCHRRNVAWLNGQDCSSLALYLHGVEYAHPDGSKASGPYLAVFFESLNSIIQHPSTENSLPRLQCDVATIGALPLSFGLKASFVGTEFAHVELSHLEPAVPQKTNESQLLVCTYLPSTDSPKDTSECFGCTCVDLEILHPTPATFDSGFQTKSAKVDFISRDWGGKHPLLHYLMTTLAVMPVYQVVECCVMAGKGIERPQR